MSDQFSKLLEKWSRKVVINETLHNELEAKNQKWHYIIGLPAILFATIAGATLFSEIDDPRVKAAVGVVGLIAAVLAAVQTFFSFAKKSEGHRLAKIRLGDVRQDIEILEAYPPPTEKAEKEEINKIGEQMDSIRKEAPSIKLDPTRQDYLASDALAANPGGILLGADENEE